MARLALYGGDPVRSEGSPPWPIYDEREEQALLSVLRSGKWGRHDGSVVEQFERAFAQRHGAKHGVAVTNGTAALEVALYALGVSPGDEVIVPAYTFVATATAVKVNGGVPVFADIEPDTYNISIDSIRELITDKTVGVIPVHFAGMPADMDGIRSLAQEHGTFVVEDAAHAHGAAYRGRPAGSIGEAGTFSFQSSKNVTSGEGGIVLTQDDGIYEKLYARHTCGRLPGKAWYDHHVVGSNTRLGEFQAAVLSVQLARMEEQNRRRIRNAAVVDEAVGASGVLSPMRPVTDEGTERAYHLYMFRYDPGIPGVTRELFAKAMGAEGIGVSLGYHTPLYKQPVFAAEHKDLHLPNVERAVSESLWISQQHFVDEGTCAAHISDALAKVAANADELRSRGDPS